MRNKNLLIAFGVIALLAVCVAFGDKTRMMYLFESAVHTVRGFFGA